MSCSKWAYTPEVCDGDICVGDCDLCDKPKRMGDEFEKCNYDGEKMVEKCDYISRQAVIDYLDSNNEPWRDWVNDIPSADVVEVVRCKDCKHWQDQEEGIVEVPICTRDTIMIIGENGYCSYGERAEA